MFSFEAIKSMLDTSSEMTYEGTVCAYNPDAATCSADEGSRGDYG
jgi:hypothetical protein